MSNISDIVSYDPSTITITRHAKVAHSGGFSWALTTLAPMRVRLYQISTRNQREITLPEGEVKTVELGILIDGITADVIVGHGSYDSFTLVSTDSPPEIREFRIVAVRRYDDVNVDDNTQCDCVAV